MSLLSQPSGAGGEAETRKAGLTTPSSITIALLWKEKEMKVSRRGMCCTHEVMNDVEGYDVYPSVVTSSIPTLRGRGEGHQCPKQQVLRTT